MIFLKSACLSSDTNPQHPSGITALVSWNLSGKRTQRKQEPHAAHCAVRNKLPCLWPRSPVSSVSICKTLVGSLVSLQVRKNLIEQSKIISPSGIFFFLSYKFLFFVVAFLFHLQEIFQYFFQDWFNIDELQLDFACLRRSFFLQFWKIILLDRIAEVVGFSFLAS